MPKKPLKRVQFPKNVTAKQIVQHIRKSQDEWAKRFPERAHRLYPQVYDAQGNRIQQSSQ